MALTYPKNRDRIFAGLPERLPAYCGDFDSLIDAVNDILDGDYTLTDLTLTGTLEVDGTSTFNGAIDSTLTTDSSSSTTGAIKTAGGLGVAKALYVGTNLVVEGATDATTSTTGSLKTAGGLGVAKAIFAGTTINAGTRLITAAGTVSAPSLVVGANDNGWYEVSSTQQGISIGNTLVGGFNASGLFTDVISEQTAAAGVTIDSVLLKDGGVSNTAATITASFTPITAQNNITAGTGGAIIVTNYLTTINTDAGGDAFSLANGTVPGQLKKILLVADGGGDAVITPTALSGGTTITMNDATDFVILKWAGAAWIAIENFGCTIA